MRECSCDLENEIKRFGRPMHMNEMPNEPILNPQGWDSECNSVDAEAALRMLRNNLHPDVALDWQKLVVYGGSGRAARNWKEYHRIAAALKGLKNNETLFVQSGKPVYIARTHKYSPRVVIANSNIVSHWSDQAYFDELDRAGLTMYGQMTAGSWIYTGFQGILQGTYETMAACAKKEFGVDSLRGKFVLSAGMGAMSGAQPLAVTMNEGVLLCVEARPERIKEKVRKGRCDKFTLSLKEALRWVKEAKSRGQPLSVGLAGNAARIYPELVRFGIIPDIVTDQTPAHDLLSYIPKGYTDVLDELRIQKPERYKKYAQESIVEHISAMLEMQKRGAVCFDYGNNLRGQAEKAGLKIRGEDGKFLYSGFVERYIRPLFYEGRGPFRWAALSGNSKDIFTIDKLLFEMFTDIPSLARWITKARQKEEGLFQGLPSRVCWLGYGERAEFGLVLNDLVKRGEVKAPIVIGRDHLDAGSVASPNRETEGMRDGSDAISDWALLNFAGNAIAGASWVSFHNGGGVGIGYSQHAGMAIVADGTKNRAKRLERALTFDPGIGIARHVDAGYEKAKEIAKERGVKIPK